MNSTTGNGSTESSSCISETAWSRIGKSIYLSLILAVSLVGNSLIVTIVYKTPTLRKPINYFIANMAMSDLLYLISWLPFDLSELHTNSWLVGGQFGQALCKFVFFVTDFSTAVSIQNLILIAVDRFGAVVFPLRSPLISSKLCPFFILATWIVAVVVNLPYLFAFKVVEDSGEMQCELEWEKTFGESMPNFAKFVVAYNSLLVYITIILLAVLYSIILIKLKTQTHPGEQSANNQQQWNRRNRNVLQMSVAINLAFVFCFLPISTNIFILEYGASSTVLPCSFEIYFHVTVLIYRAYVFVNPSICFIFSSSYRQGLRRLINRSVFVRA